MIVRFLIATTCNGSSAPFYYLDSSFASTLYCYIGGTNPGLKKSPVYPAHRRGVMDFKPTELQGFMNCHICLNSRGTALVLGRLFQIYTTMRKKEAAWESCPNKISKLAYYLKS